MDIAIRPITPDDIGAIASLARAAWFSAYSDILPPGQIDYMLAQRYGHGRFDADLADPQKWLHQALIDDVRAGFATCDIHEGEFRLHELYIHPDMQHRGLGAALVAHAAGLAREHGYPALILAVNKNNAQAIRAYDKYGFRVRDEIVADIGGGFVMDDYIMEKPA
ncbi:MAG: GNAT family N-acetyltransferase [Azoarcus sp.]|jgi:ribosomal protein S18 acetylase RimI-like enzyme|nr:GNAT family N-acetyltransferase [Azoarcus sp.]